MEQEGDMLAVSLLVEDLQDALLNYQVGDNAYNGVLQQTLRHFGRQPNNRQYMTRTAD